MEFERQVLFLFSTLGAVNGFFFGFYFLWHGTKKKSNYFLGALILVLSIRILKSAFFYFNPDLSQWFIQLGISACLFIGPCLYLYSREEISSAKKLSNKWVLHLLPIIIATVAVWFLLPYYDNRVLWSKYLIRVIYVQWLLYIVVSFRVQWPSIKKVFQRKKLDDVEIWGLNILFGIALIWLAHATSPYTSYIVGALSFSFIFYLILLTWLFRRKGKSVLKSWEPKYANKKIDTSDQKTISEALSELMIEKKYYTNPNLKLSDVAEEIGISPHLLSQYLNDNLGKGFPRFLNEYRIKAVETMMRSNKNFSLEGIGKECGFKSNSTFYNAFKDIKGVTPAKYKRQLN